MDPAGEDCAGGGVAKSHHLLHHGRGEGHFVPNDGPTFRKKKFVESLLDVIGLVYIPGGDPVGEGLVRRPCPVSFVQEPRCLPGFFFTRHAVLPD